MSTRIPREVRRELLERYLKLLNLGPVAEPWAMFAFWIHCDRAAGLEYAKRNVLLATGLSWHTKQCYGVLCTGAAFICLLKSIDQIEFLAYGAPVALIAAVLLIQAHRLKKSFAAPFCENKLAFVIELVPMSTARMEYIARVPGLNQLTTIAESKSQALEDLEFVIEGELNDSGSMIHFYDLVEELLDEDEDSPPDPDVTRRFLFTAKRGHREYA